MSFDNELSAPDPALQASMQAWRHDLHRHPETAYEEHRTSAQVAAYLKAMPGMTVHTGLGVTGVVGVLAGRQAGERHIALRADMDALPLTELNTFAHASCHHGRMHGCGHDGHTSMLLGAASLLSADPDFAGTVYFIFQPAEDGGAGARNMIEDGLFTRFPIQEIYGMHNWPGLPAGQFAVHAGAVMASTDAFDIRITGKGGHAAMPDTLIDPVLIAGHLITAIQSIVARNMHPVDSAVISLTQMLGGSGAYNVIPEQVSLRGTIRTFSQEHRDRIRQRLRDLVSHIAQGLGGEAQVEFAGGYPPTINHAQQAEHCLHVTRQLVGAEQVQWNPQPSMGAEDFAFMLLEKPGAYIWIGNDRNADSKPLHNHYDFNDDILTLGAQYWTRLVQHRCPAS
ncbi:MAG: M20 aminoacylase family protein [Thiolinea sp.]